MIPPQKCKFAMLLSMLLFAASDPYHSLQIKGLRCYAFGDQQHGLGRIW